MSEEERALLDLASKAAIVAALVWIALALSFCSGPQVVNKIQPAPVVLYSVNHPVAPSAQTVSPPQARQPAASPVSFASTVAAGTVTVFQAILPIAIPMVVILTLGVALWVGREPIFEFLRSLFGTSPADAGVTLLTIGATAFAAFKAELGENNPIILVVGGMILLTPLLMRMFDTRWKQVLAAAAIASLLVAAPVSSVDFWPFFTHEIEHVGPVHISGYQATIEAMQKIGVWTVASVAILFVLFVINAALVLLETPSKKPAN